MGRTSSSLLRVRKNRSTSAKALQRQHDVVAAQGVFGQAGAQHVDAVQGGLGGDAVLVAGEGERLVGDLEVKVLGHLELVAHLAHPQRDLVLAAQRPALTAGGRGDGLQFFFGGRQQLVAFAGALVGQGGVVDMRPARSPA